MKKSILLAGLMAAAMFALSACSGNSKETTAAPQTTEASGAPSVEATEAPVKETPAAETTKARPKVSQEEVEAFAQKVQEAFADQSVEALSGLVTYPLVIYYQKDQSEEVADAEEFMDLDPEYLFGEELLGVLAGLDTSEMSMGPAGVSMGEEGPCVIFDVSEDGALGITEIYE